MEKLHSEQNMEKEKQAISVEGTPYTYLKDRLMGGYIYSNADRSAYLRINTPVEIAGEINITRDLYERGFPVPQMRMYFQRNISRSIVFHCRLYGLTNRKIAVS